MSKKKRASSSLSESADKFLGNSETKERMQARYEHSVPINIEAREIKLNVGILKKPQKTFKKTN
jgi:hypothetical protein